MTKVIDEIFRDLDSSKYGGYTEFKQFIASALVKILEETVGEYITSDNRGLHYITRLNNLIAEIKKQVGE